MGLLLIINPAAAGALYRLPKLSPTGRALCRIVGGLMASEAIVLAAFAADPEANARFAPLLLAGCVVNSAADAAACGAREIRWGQVAGAGGFQVALGIALAAYMFDGQRASRAKPPSEASTPAPMT